MKFSPAVDRLIQAQAHAEAEPRPTTLTIWRDGIVVEMRENGRRIGRRVSWVEVETAYINPVIVAIDLCSREMSDSK
jgi:hypothetical protein